MFVAYVAFQPSSFCACVCKSHKDSSAALSTGSDRHKNYLLLSAFDEHIQAHRLQVASHLTVTHAKCLDDVTTLGTTVDVDFIGL